MLTHRGSKIYYTSSEPRKVKTLVMASHPHTQAARVADDEAVSPFADRSLGVRVSFSPNWSLMRDIEAVEPG